MSFNNSLNIHASSTSYKMTYSSNDLQIHAFVSRMTWIEGVGDEVPIFIILAVVVVVIFMVLAWKSTDVPESSLTIPVLTFTITSRETPTTSGIVNSEEGPPSRPEETSSNQEIPLTLNPDLIASHQTSSVRNIVTNPETNEENNAETSPTLVEEENNLRRRCHSSSSTNSQIISVKLMYMDDTHRIVESPSNITLGDFKKYSILLDKFFLCI